MQNVMEEILNNRLSKSSYNFSAQDVLDFIEWQHRNGVMKNEYCDAYDAEQMIRNFLRSK